MAAIPLPPPPPRERGVSDGPFGGGGGRGGGGWEEPDDERSRGMIVDGDTRESVRSSLPVATRKVLKKDQSAADMMAEAQHQIKAREQMQARTRV